MLENIAQITKNFKIAIRTLMYLLYVVIFISILTYTNHSWYTLGTKAGIFSAIFLWIIAIPGIVKRFNLQGNFKKIGNILMASRRELGICMFLLAWSHYLWLRAFVYLQNHSFPAPEDFILYEKIGFLAFWLSLILFATSNTFSVKLLKRKWNLLHKLNYLITALVILHTAFLPAGFTPVTVITSLVLLTQIFSWRYYFNRKKNLKTT